MSLQKVIELQNKFHILKDWTITYDDTSKYKAQCCTNPKTREATIYEWHSDCKEPENYILHEIMHICIKEINRSNDYKINKESEELFIQDLLVIMSTDKKYEHWYWRNCNRIFNYCPECGQSLKG